MAGAQPPGGWPAAWGAAGSRLPGGVVSGEPSANSGQLVPGACVIVLLAMPFYPFCRRGNWRTEVLCDLLQVTRLERGNTEIRRLSSHPSPCFPFLVDLGVQTRRRLCHRPGCPGAPKSHCGSSALREEELVLAGRSADGYQGGKGCLRRGLVPGPPGPAWEERTHFLCKLFRGRRDRRSLFHFKVPRGRDEMTK